VNKFIFDIDGTLTPSRQKIDPEFEKFFIEFCINNDVYLVTGSDYAKTQEQLGDYLLRWPVYVYNCGGNEKWAKGEHVQASSWDGPEELYELLNGWLQSSKFPARMGQHIEQRSGMINFSIVGRGATLAERKMYVEWDLANRERETIAYQVNAEFEGITATIGGETGIDIHPTGWDKGQILKDFDLKEDNLFFFGDKTEPGGNDYPLAKHIKNSYAVRDWRDTWERLLYLQEAKIAA
jgi:HAD-superfamily hydrolase, subfamily IIB